MSAVEITATANYPVSGEALNRFNVNTCYTNIRKDTGLSEL